MTCPKILGQASPAATTLVALYTTPACARATIDTLTICNRSAVATTFRISVAPKGVADAVAHYLYYDTAIAANATLNLTELNIRLTETDELRIHATAATLSLPLKQTQARAFENQSENAPPSTIRYRSGLRVCKMQNRKSKIENPKGHRENQHQHEDENRRAQKRRRGRT